MSHDELSDDEDYNFDREHQAEQRYPVHDCCEFQNAEALRGLVFLAVEDSGDDSKVAVHKEDVSKKHTDSSSSDDNDSTAAAHAAAIGHSPQPIKTTLNTLATVPEHFKEVSLTKANGENPTAETGTDGKGEDEPKTDSISKKSESAKGYDEHDETKPTVGDTSEPTNVEKDIKSLDEGNGAVAQSKTDNEVKMTSDDAMNVDDEPQNATVEKSDNNISPKLKKREIDPDIDLNERDEDDNTALHVAIHARKLEHVKILLEAGASYRIRCDGSLPVHTAISIGALSDHRQFAYECVVVLHEYGADLSIKDDAVHTPLFLACMFNLPQIVSYLLSDDDALSTVNSRADRAGNRPLHAAAKYDTPVNPSFGKGAASIATGQTQSVPQQHPDANSASLPSFGGKQAPVGSSAAVAASAGTPSTEALLTQVLLGSTGIEIDALNVMGQTPLHVACARRNWPVARLLLQAGSSPSIKDRRGFTPGQLAYKRAMPIPNDLVEVLGDPPEKGLVPSVRELIVDPDGSTLLLCHELCMLHRTCPPIRRDSEEPPPENVRRLKVLVDPETGILRSGEFGGLVWKGDARRAAIGDVLKVHDYPYVERVSMVTSTIPEHPNAIAQLDGDTNISHWSFEAAMRAAGSVCEAVDRVVAGDNIRNSFCAVRPPGHHAGPQGIVRCPNDPEGGSHGFCLLNNVCIGAAYARSMYRNEGIRKVAIIDFDVHHGNGTEAVIRNLVPSIQKGSISIPFMAVGEIQTSSYKPWLDETDIQNVFFSSTHGYGNRGFDQPGWFYPASGKTLTSEALAQPGMVESPGVSDFILSQTWARMGEDSKLNCCKIINVGLELPEADVDQQSRNMKQRLELRDTYRKTIFPALREFDPDLIFISAGFDAHRKDTMNFGYVGMVEDDYEWVTEHLVKIANTCCNGRVVSVLEGGYKIHGGIVSPFARSVASHVRALADGGMSRELYDPEDSEWESQFERGVYERRERKKEQEREQLRLLEEANRQAMLERLSGEGEAPEDPDAPSRKRRRNQVNYKELFKQMQQEGFAG